jgi:hypothetical protein
MMKKPEELCTSLNTNLTNFIDHYLKLEIMSIQKYIFDFVFYLVKVADESPSSEIRRTINDSLGSSVIVSSIVNILEVAVQEENDQAKKDLF